MNLKFRLQNNIESLLAVVSSDAHKPYNDLLLKAAEDLYTQLLTATSLEDVYRLQGAMSVLSSLIVLRDTILKELEFRKI